MDGRDGYIRRMEDNGKMIYYGVYLPEEYTGKVVGRWNLKGERSRELEGMNPVFGSHGNRVFYRIRCVHYMSSRASKEQLLRTGETWAITFSEVRVAECFIHRYPEFKFFVGLCTRD